MGLSLRGSTSGAIDINPPAEAGDNAITLPASNGSANQFFKNSGTAGIVTYSSMVETSTGVGIGTAQPVNKFQVGIDTTSFNITSDGKVGIGSDNPSDVLDIQHSTTGGGIKISTVGNTYSGITADADRSAADNHLLAIEGHWNGTPVAEIAFKTGDDTANKDNGEIIFRTSSANNLNGSERLRILSGGGITFNGDTATANALDDYEEGTITTWRLVKGDANTNGANHAQTEVQYTKIGRCVYISGHIRTDGTETGKTGNLKLVSTADGSTAATLPFVPNHRGGLPIVHTRSCSTTDTTYALSVGFREDNSTVYVYANDMTGDYIIDGNTLDTNTQTNLVITFNGHYFTDS